MIGSSSSKMQKTNFCKDSGKSAAADTETTATSETLIKCSKFPFLGEHSLHTTDCTSPCNNAGLEQIQIGYFYELNQQNLPRRSPIHLKSIRVVMVTEKTDYNVTVKFPSSSSLRTYFRRVFRNEKKQDLNQTVGISPPQLDEEFVMGSKPAKEVLARQILPSEFSNRKKLQSFWLVEPPKEEYSNEPNSSSTSSPMDDKMEIPAATGGGFDGSVKRGSSGLHAALNSAGLMRWGVRRRVAFVGRHKDLKFDSNPAEPGNDGQSSLMDPVIKSEDEAEDEEAIEETLELEGTERRMSTRKRTREISMNSIKKAKAIKQHEKMIKGELSRRKKKNKKAISAGASIKKKISAGASIRKKIKIAGVQGNEKLSYDRWSKQRYKTAEGRMLDILKETKAVFGKPILRRELRVEARKYIGDTGLLDHLLKHMAGKVSPNGVDRFRRRHNSEGEMEYWLESADLVNVRKEAGVIDPYWTPPPGWKLGDNPSQHPVCAKDFQLLRDEMADLKRNMEGLLVLKSGMSCMTKEATVAESLEAGQGNMIQQQPVAALMSSSSNNLSPTQAAVVAAPLKGMYDNLVKKKAQLEQQLVEISVSLNQMQKEVGKITSTVVVEDTTKSSVLVASAAERTDATAGKEEEEEKRRESSLVVLKREGDDPILPEDNREKEMNEAQKAAKRQRIRSGFRICKPQGTFLWPNMVGGGGTTPGSTSTAAAAGAGCCNNILALSPHEHGDGGVGGEGHRHDHQHQQHPQVMVQVQEDLNMVPTPSSVNSSSSASHCLQLLTTTGGGGPKSPLMKPLAERRAVTVTVMVPDLNDDAIAYEDEDNQNNISTTTTTTTTTSYLHHGHGHGHGPHGYLHHGKGNTNNNNNNNNNSSINSRKELYGTTTPTSSLSAHQAFVLPSPHQQQQQQEWGRGETQLVQSEATAAVGRRSTELVQYHRKQHQHQQQLQQHIDMGLGMGIYGQDYMNGPV